MLKVKKVFSKYIVSQEHVARTTTLTLKKVEQPTLQLSKLSVHWLLYCINYDIVQKENEQWTKWRVKSCYCVSIQQSMIEHFLTEYMIHKCIFFSDVECLSSRDREAINFFTYWHFRISILVKNLKMHLSQIKHLFVEMG